MTDWFDEAGHGSAVDVEALMDSGAPVLIWQTVAAGALVSVGTTSDGGALAVTVTLDGRWRREYFRDSDELVDWLARAKSAVEAAPPPPTASTGQGKRQRRSRGL